MSTITNKEHKVKSRLKTDPFFFLRLSSFHNPILLSGKKKENQKRLSITVSIDNFSFSRFSRQKLHFLYNQ